MTDLWLFAILVAVVCAAVPLTVWLKRAGDQAWAAHVRRRRQAQIVVRLVVDAEAFTRAMREAGAAASRLGAAMDQTRGPLEKLGRDIDRALKRILPPNRGRA